MGALIEHFARFIRSEDSGQGPKNLGNYPHTRGLFYGIRRESSRIELNGPHTVERRLSLSDWYGRCY